MSAGSSQEVKGIDDAVYEFACVANNELHAAREMLSEGGVSAGGGPERRNSGR